MRTIYLLQNLFQMVLKEMDIAADFTNLVKKASLNHGDYTSEIAMQIAKSNRCNPLQLAQQIAEKLRSHVGDKDYSIEVIKPGFINIRLSDSILIENLTEILKANGKYCSGFVEDNRMHIVEFSSPNIAKPFTIGHLRSTIIGDSIARILAYCGHKVIKDNHLGDWGTQFGKMIVAIQKWGNIEQIKNAENPVRELVALYQKFHEESGESSEEEQNQSSITDESLINEAREWFVRLEQGDTEARDLWKFCVDCSMVEFDRIYERLGVKFDMSLGESFFEDKMHYVFSDIEAKGIGQISEGALFVFFPNEALPPLMVRKRDGGTLYATRDLATDLYRLKQYGGDVVIINEVGKEQAQYFEQIFAVEEMLGYFKKGQRIHIKHGHFRFPEGKMSTRKGKVIWLDEVLDEAIDKALVLSEDHDRNSAEIIAIGALKFNDLMRNPESDIVFSWDRILNMKGDSGPYVQYTAVRINSLIDKAFEVGMSIPNDLHLVLDDNDRPVLRILEGFYDSLNNARCEYSTSSIASYLIELCREYNKYYSLVKIVKDRNVKGLVISFAVRDVIVLCLGLLGISVPKKM